MVAVISRLLLPGFTSHIIVVLTLVVPVMILGETSLSFLGLGLRSPAVNWVVMLQDRMKIEAVANIHWMLFPLSLIVITVLCFNLSATACAMLPILMPRDERSDMEAVAENVLEIEDLRVSFYTEEGEVRAVDGVSFSIPRGSIVGLVGESGCGKSVTSYSVLRLIQRPGEIKGGSIRFNPQVGGSVDITALDKQDDAFYQLRGGAISMIFQEPMTALSPVHTVGNQICEAIMLHVDADPERAEEIAAEMLDKVGIPNARSRLDQYPFEMSGGMRQRVVIAMALACAPEVLIADEPTTALDVTIQAQIIRLIKSLQRDLGTSTLLITHDLGLVAQLVDHIAVMYLGRIVEQGDVRTVMKAPRHPYTMGLLESLPGLALDKERLSSIKGSVPSLAERPPGCPFHPRCPHAEPGVCDRGDPPELHQIGEARMVACLRLEAIHGGLLQ